MKMKYLFNALLDILDYARTLVGSFLRGFRAKELYRPHFVKGERVEAISGEMGTVIRLYQDIKSNEIVACSVKWDREYNGEKLSLILPAIDLGIKYNPVLRKIRN